jgi:hypothetical protein
LSSRSVFPLLSLAPAVALASEDEEVVGTVTACACCVGLTIASKASTLLSSAEIVDRAAACWAWRVEESDSADSSCEVRVVRWVVSTYYVC